MDSPEAPGQTARGAASRRAWRLSTQIFIGLVILLGLVLVLILASYRVALRERRAAEIENAVAIGQVLSSAVETFSTDLETTTLAIAAALSAQPEPLSQQRNGHYLTTMLAARPNLRALFITDPAGKVIVAGGATGLGTDLSSRQYVKALRAGAKVFWSDMLRGLQSGTVTVAFGRVIPSAADTPKGYVIAAFFPERVFVRLPVRLAGDARLTLLDRRGQLLFTNVRSSVPSGVTDFSAVPEVRRALGGETVVLDQRAASSSGEARFGVIVPVPRTGWVVSYTRPIDVIQAALQAQFLTQAAQLAIILLVLGALAATFIILLTRPLSTLAASAAAVARGERPHISPATGPLLEVIQLAEGMAVMTRAVAEREDALQAARADAEGARGRLAFLAEASALLTSSLDHATILRHLARLTVPRMADWAIVYSLDSSGKTRRLEVAHPDPATGERVRALLNRYAPEVTGPPAESIRTGRSVLIENVSDQPLETLYSQEEVRTAIRDLGVRSLMVVPLIARGRTLGAMLFASKEERRLGREDLTLAEDLARRAAVAVDNARLYEQEHTVARTLQQAFLPANLPQVPGLVLHAAYLPGSAGAEIGGDWYDAFWLPDGRVGLSIGDVTGHGIDAAVVMGQVRQAIRASAWDDPSPSSILTRAGRLLHLLPGEEMATALFGILDPAQRTLTYASAGHPAPILAHDGKVEPLAGGGLPLGMRRTTQFQNWNVQLPPGAFLVLFTDGLIEFERNPIEGERALLEAVRAEAEMPSADRALGLQERVLGNRRPPDDVAIITLSMVPLPVGTTEMTLPAIPSALPLIRQAIRHATEAAGLPTDRATALLVAACEAVNNAIEHAYGIIPGEVTVRAAVRGNALVVTVEDRGRWRPPREDGGGRGMILMRTLADRADFERTEGGTTVRLEAQLAPVADAAGGESR